MSTGYFILASILAIGVLILVRMILIHWLAYRVQRREMLTRQMELLGRTVALLSGDSSNIEPVASLRDSDLDLRRASLSLISGFLGFQEEQLQITRATKAKKQELEEHLEELDLHARLLVNQIEEAGAEPAWRPPPLPDWITSGVRPITPPPGGGANPAEGGNDLAAENP